MRIKHNHVLLHVDSRINREFDTVFGRKPDIFNYCENLKKQITKIY